jgi:hypothetical protein
MEKMQDDCNHKQSRLCILECCAAFVLLTPCPPCQDWDIIYNTEVEKPEIFSTEITHDPLLFSVAQGIF